MAGNRGNPGAAADGSRVIDCAARAYLGPRRNSVFSPPVRPAFGAADYLDAKERSRRSSEHGLALSQQCYAILGKIDEVDQLMSPDLQHRVVEVHPEVSFTALNGDVPLAEAKKSKAGRAMRVNLLSQAWGIDVVAIVQQHSSKDAKPDDILDAMAACWTAERVLAGTAVRMPEQPPTDSRGLRMEIVR